MAVGVRAGFEDEERVLGLVAGEVDVLGGRAERVVRVVGADLEIAGRDYQTLAGEAGGEGGAALGGVGGLLDRAQVLQLGVGPPRGHQLGQLGETDG